jgi:hypothetical protein
MHRNPFEEVATSPQSGGAGVHLAIGIYELRSETFSDTLRGPLAFFFGQTEG